MTVKELINIEEGWLKYEMNYKFDLDFNSYLKLLKQLKEIGEITHQYFVLVTEYNAYLETDNTLTLNEKREKLEKFNEKLLNSEVEFSFPLLDINKLKK